MGGGVTLLSRIAHTSRKVPMTLETGLRLLSTCSSMVGGWAELECTVDVNVKHSLEKNTYIVDKHMYTHFNTCRPLADSKALY